MSVSRRRDSHKPVVFSAFALAGVFAAALVLTPAAVARDNDREAAASQAVEAPPAVNPGEDFKQQFEALKQKLEALGGRIKQSAGEIEALTSPETAQKKIATLQSLIANTLGLVTDNGEVAQLGRKVVDYAQKKQKEFEGSSRFTAEERAYLQKEWARVGAETKAAVGELSDARSRLTAMLKSVQTRGDYLNELESLNNAKKMLEVVRALAAELRSASSALERFSKSARPPQPDT